MLRPIIAFCMSLLLFGCSGAKIYGERDINAGPAPMPKVVYVMDFELEAADIHSDPGLLRSQHERGGPVRETLSRLRGQEDPAVRARELVSLMSISLLDELAKRNLVARRLGAADAVPVNGLLVRGIFTYVDEGNRLRRVALGFGSGETDIQLVVSVDDLAQGWPKPYYEMDAKAGSGKMPGAVISLNPYTAAAKFVLSKHDLEKNVRQAASKVAGNIAERIGRPAGSP